jgi:hypothetical protein
LDIIQEHRAKAQKWRVKPEKVSEYCFAEKMKFQRTEAAKALDRIRGALHNKATAFVQDDSYMKVELLLNTQVNSA